MAGLHNGLCVSVPDALSLVRLSVFGLKREAPISKSDVTDTFEARFDSDTLFYDVFVDDDARCVLAIAPPPMNCAASFDVARFSLGKDGPAVTARVHHHSKYSIVQLPVPAGVVPDSLRIDMNGRAVTVPVRSSLCRALANRRIMFLLSKAPPKDNPLPLIEDWVRYNVTIHRADAVLLYDNDSSIYELPTLESLLGSIAGLATFAVVPWRYPFGPEQSNGTGWEYCFCQMGALEHVRWALRSRPCSAYRLPLSRGRAALSQQTNRGPAGRRSWRRMARSLRAWFVGRRGTGGREA